MELKMRNWTSRIEFLGDDGDSLDLDEDLDVLNVGW